MSSVISSKLNATIEHHGENLSNDIRRRIACVEPRGLRTFTPSLAVISRSEGCYHFTPEGRKLADFTSGVLVANLGHNPPRWWQRIFDYMGFKADREHIGFSPVVPLTAYNTITLLETQACERLLSCLQSQHGGSRLERVLWSASGSEGVIKALQVSLIQDPKRQMILATRGGFHGKKGLAGAVTGCETDPNRDPRVRFISFPRKECFSIETRRQPLDLEPFEIELRQIDEQIGDQICCLITEPYLGGGGSYHPQKEYLQLLERFCREREIVFILDEVQSNFGRTGSLFAFTEYGIEPDIVVLGKGLANGIPIDAAVGRADLFNELEFGEGSDTWSGHPLGCAAVLATLDEFESTNVLAEAQQLSRILEAGLTSLVELSAVAAIRGEGTVWGIQCTDVGERSSQQIAQEIVRACYLGDRDGRAIHLLGPLSGNVLRVSPPLVMSPGDARVYLFAMYNMIRQVSARSTA